MESIVYKCIDKEAGQTRTGISKNQEFTNELHNPITRKFQRRKLYSSYRDNIQGADLVDLQLLSKYNKGIRFLLFIADIYSKYVQVFSLKDKKGITITGEFQKNLDEFRHKPSKIWLDQDSEFYNKLWFHENSIEIYSTHNEGKSVIAESFI